MTSESKAHSSRRGLVLKWSLFVVMAGICLAVDLVTKHLAEQRIALDETIRVYSFFYLDRTANDGAAFGLLGGKSTFIIVANFVALAVVGVYVLMERRTWLAGIAGGAVVGGSIGNLIQRLSGDGHVTDFMKFPHWPNFNMADVFIDAGIAAIVIGLVWEAVRLYRAGRQTPASP
ncbi:MAG: signal peptidase II [Thermoleophilia bacterium]|nr:signal peptidase II [Thermoleophilia bacterium]